MAKQKINLIEFQSTSIFLILTILIGCVPSNRSNSSAYYEHANEIDSFETRHQSSYPKFDFENILVNGMRLSDKKSKIISQWGLPLKYEDDDSYTDEEKFEVWCYEQNKIIVSKEEDYFISFSVSDKSTRIYPTELSIGNSIIALVDSLSENERSNILKNRQLKLPLLYAGKASDEYLTVNFDSLQNISELIYDGLCD